MESTITLDDSLATVLDATSDAIAIVTLKTGQFAAINDSHSRLFGFSLETLNKRTISKFFQFDKPVSSQNILQQLEHAKHFDTFLWRCSNYLGGTVNVSLTCNRLKVLDETYLLLNSIPISESDSATKFSGMVNIAQAFPDSEAIWRSITESSADHIMLVDTDGTILYINHTVSGLTVEEVMGRSAFDFVNPDQALLLKQNYDQVIRTGRPTTFELEYRSHDSVTHLENRIGPVLRNGKVIALTVASRDVTGWRRTLVKLENSQQHLRHGLQASATGIWDWDLKSNKIIWSDGVESLFGLEPGSFEGSYDAYRKLLPPDDADKVDNAVQQTIKYDVPLYVEHRCIYPDGSLHWLCGRGKMYRDDSGKPLRMIGTVTDITQRRRAEETLRHSEFVLSKSQEIAHIGSYSWDVPSNKYTWSDEMFRIFGLSRKDFDGSPESVIENAVHPDDRDKLYQGQVKILQEKKPQPMEFRIIRPDGSIRYVDANAYLSFDKNGDVTGMIGTVQDITDKVVARQELDKHRQHLEELVTERTEEIREQALILEQIHDAVVATDLDGIITSWNRGAERMYGYNAEEAIGHHISLVYSERDRQTIMEKIIAPLKEKQEHEVEVRVCRKSGEIFYVLLSLSMQQNIHGKVIGMIGYSIDITARKIAEQEVLRHKNALEAANKELKAFSYSVSHDLRTPLRAIDGFSATVISDYYDLLDADGKDYLGRIRANTQRMAALIDDMLQLSRVSRHVIDKVTIDLGQLALDVARKYQYEYPNRDIQFEVDEKMHAEGDAGLIRIALDNLIGNAWKYTSTTEHPKILFRKQQQNGATVYCIQDNGVGFDMRYAGKLFGAFQRLHHSDEFPGNGIGLATVSRIINRHGGKIWAESKINQGARFFFTLPANHH